MTLLEKIEYNKKSASKYSWNPSLFGASDFNEDLILKIENLQKEYGLEVDGLVGPNTQRIAVSAKLMDKEQYILCGGKKVPINWPKVIVMDETGGLTVPAKNFKKKAGRKPNMFVVHWDACLNSTACASVLKDRGLSVHFCIDNDGTIYQLVDCDDIAYHAGAVNAASVGVEVSNAFYPKFQSWYQKNGFGPRPVYTNTKVHDGSIQSHLGFYKVQEEALSVLIKTVCSWYGIKLQTPSSITEVPDVAKGSYSGVVSHYHVTKDKIDCAGVDLSKLII